jgi:hypothetical protein
MVNHKERKDLKKRMPGGRLVAHGGKFVQAAEHKEHYRIL